MNDLDHMLNGRLSSRHHQQMIQQVQRERFAQEVRMAQPKHKTISLVRAGLVALINLIAK